MWNLLQQTAVVEIQNSDTSFTECMSQYKYWNKKMAPPFDLDGDFVGFGYFSGTVQKGLSMAKAIIETDKFIEIVIDNLSDVTKPTAEDVRGIVDTLAVKISVIEIAAHLDAYAFIYRATNPNHIYFNPLLLMQIALAEKRGSTHQHLRALSLFIAIKTVHEYSHLIHPLVSARLRDQVKKRAFGGENKQKMKTPEKSKGGAKFGDFGEMVEYDLLGGISELYSSSKQPEVYSMDHIILYDHPGAREGHLVRVKSSDYIISAALDEMRLEIEEDAVDKPYKGPRGHLVGSARFSAPGEAAESDIIDGEVEAGKCGGIKDPTF